MPRGTGRRSAIVALLLATGAIFWIAAAPASGPTCRGVPATIVGTPGNDVLNGTPGSDYFYADAGDDEVRGGGGADYICGGLGNDRLLGQAGADYLLGEGGDDRLNGGTDRDVADFSTSSGAVTVDLEAGNASGDGADSLFAVEGAIGSPFADDLFGSPADDVLSGYAGSDLIMGFEGSDFLTGEDGADTLRGGAGSDFLGGQRGIDACVDGESVIECERGGGTVRLDLSSDFDYVDPALSFFSQSWQLQNATCTRLVSYPDAPAPKGSTLIPEAAVALPTISPNGRRYTFTIRSGLRFSPPSNEVVNAQTFKFTIERTLNPTMQSPGSSFIRDIVGAEAYVAGKATEVTGIVANGMKLSITLVAPKGDFLARLALPFFCAVPTTSPIDPAGARLPSAGPYYVDSWNRGANAVALRNPNYRGRRASNFDRIEWTMRVTPADQVARVESGQTDHAQAVLAADRPRLHDTYGPGSPAAAAGRQSYFVETALVFWYLALNAERTAFANEKLRRAVAYALNRIDLAALHGFDGGVATDQILPPGLAGYRDHDVFPLAGDLATAQSLAAEAGVTPETPIDVEMYSFNTSFGPGVAQYVKDALAPLGISVKVQLFDRVVQHEKMATRGEPFDIGLEGWGVDYNDPYNFLDYLLNGSRLQPTNNINVSYFDDPVFNARLDAAAPLTGAQRFRTYAELDRDLSAAAPIVPYVNTTSVLFFSDRIGCHTFPPVYRVALNTLCLRR